MRPDQVQVSKAEPASDCKQLGAITGFEGDYEDSLSSMREKAAQLGANYLVIDGPAHGRAYLCPPPCRPSCSPGYLCLDGKCTSACNPPCRSGEQCGRDRVCHPLEPVGAPI